MRGLYHYIKKRTVPGDTINRLKNLAICFADGLPNGGNDGLENRSRLAFIREMENGKGKKRKKALPKIESHFRVLETRKPM